MRINYRTRRAILGLISTAGVSLLVIFHPKSYEPEIVVNAQICPDESAECRVHSGLLAVDALAELEVKGRAPKTGYSRDEFYQGWPNIDGCSLRQRIIRRELGSSAVLDDDSCAVISGEYLEPYTGEMRTFTEKSELSKGIQIDHVVALSDAWQKGAQYKDADTRYQIATDPLNLLAVDGSANQKKSDNDAASWLPANKSFRCEYVARQISVKRKYGLWVTQAESEAMSRVLQVCPEQTIYE